MKPFSIITTKNREAALGSKNSTLSISSLFDEGAKTWDISYGWLFFIISLPFIVAMSGVVAALFGKAAYKWYTGEDRFAENLQVVFWVISFVLSLIIVQKNTRDHKIYAILYGILCVGIFFIIGEELSWGQRFFGWVTPESMKVLNKQDETNIHNIYGIGYTIKWLHLVIGAYGTIMPLIVLRSKALQRFRSHVSMLVPHYTLIPFFFIPFIWRIYRNLFKAPKEYYFAISEYSEVIEIIISMAFMFFLYFQVRQIRMKNKKIGKSNNEY